MVYLNSIIKVLCVAAVLGNCAVFLVLYPQYKAGKLYVTPSSIEGESEGMEASSKLFLVSELPANTFRSQGGTEPKIELDGNSESNNYGEMPGPFIREEPPSGGGSIE